MTTTELELNLAEWTIKELEADLTEWRQLALKSAAALVESARACQSWQEMCERSQKVTDGLVKLLRPVVVEPITDADMLKYYRPSRWVN